MLGLYLCCHLVIATCICSTEISSNLFFVLFKSLRLAVRILFSFCTKQRQPSDEHPVTWIHACTNYKCLRFRHKCVFLCTTLYSSSLTHCCAWPAEGRSVLHVERSWPAIQAAPTDRPMSYSTCCSQFLRGRQGGRFQSAAGGVPVWASIDSCSACEAGVFSGRRQMWPNITKIIIYLFIPFFL